MPPDAKIAYSSFFSILDAIALSSALAIAIFLKIRDRVVVISRIADRFSNKISMWLFYTLILTECVLLAIFVITGPGDPLICVAGSGFLFMGALLGTLLFKGHRGCPCFGAASTNKWFSPTLFGGLFGISLISSMQGGVEAWPIFFVATTSCMTFAAFFGGYYGTIKTFSGTKGQIANIKNSLKDFRINDGASVFIFTSTKCQVCIGLMRQINLVSQTLSKFAKLYIDIDGMEIHEDTSFAGCEVLYGSKKSKVNDLLSINSKPCVVVIDGERSYRYIGFQACSLALSKMISFPPKIEFNEH